MTIEKGLKVNIDPSSVSSSARLVSESNFERKIMAFADRIKSVKQGIEEIKVTFSCPESSAREKRSCMIKANQLYGDTAGHRRELEKDANILKNSSHGTKKDCERAIEAYDRQISVNHFDLIGLRDAYEASMPADTRRFDLIGCENNNWLSEVFSSRK